MALFVDLAGFTAFASTADPEVTFDRLQEFHAAMGEIIEQHRGTLIDFIGDGMFVIFNDPVEIADPEYHSLLAACQMRDRFSALAERWAKAGDRLGLKLALDAGYATLGRTGYPGHFKYGAVGRMINGAALTLLAAEHGMILASEHLVEAARDRVETRPVSASVREKLATQFERRSARAVNVVEVVGVRN